MVPPDVNTPIEAPVTPLNFFTSCAQISPTYRFLSGPNIAEAGPFKPPPNGINASKKAPVAPLYRKILLPANSTTYRFPSGPNTADTGLTSPPLPDGTNVPSNTPVSLNRNMLLFHFMTSKWNSSILRFSDTGVL